LRPHFETSEKELEHVIRLLEIEYQEELHQYQSKILETPVEKRREQGDSWYPVSIDERYFSAEGGIRLVIRRLVALELPNPFSVGQVAALFQNNGSKRPPALTGVIAHSREHVVHLACPGDELPDWLDESPLGLDWYFDETTFREMRIALQETLKARANRLSELREILLGYRPAYFRNAEGFAHHHTPQLNDSQNAALREALAADDAFVIHGPPGTGKTTTLVEVIRRVVAEEKRSLVVAPSNTAVDLLVERLAEAGLQVVRLGHPVRVSELVRNQTLDARLAASPEYTEVKKLRRDAVDLRARALKHKRNFVKGERGEQLAEARDLLRYARELEAYALNRILDEAQIIACTPVQVRSQWLEKRLFKTVFIDEAAQMLEPACWLAVSKGQRIIFAGDHWQLPPTVKSKEAAAAGLSETLFEKFFRRQPKVQRVERASALLNVQYRMHEAIMQFSNQVFYHGELKAHPTVAQQVLLPNLGADHPSNHPVEFIDTAGCGHEEVLNEETRSFSNPGEAQVLIEHLRLLLRDIDLHAEGQPMSIGIISPYKGQKILLHESFHAEIFSQYFKHHVTIDTVDGFQGQERDVIYLSLVRSNASGTIGFLADTRRMNVAMTRARRKLVLIGDSATLGSHGFYSDYLTYIEQLDAYHSAWEYANI
jgi:superfamily I DNA and/or RNA helicase